MGAKRCGRAQGCWTWRAAGASWLSSCVSKAEWGWLGGSCSGGGWEAHREGALCCATAAPYAHPAPCPPLRASQSSLAVNLSATPSTVVEPRPLDLARRVRQHGQQQQHALWQEEQQQQQHGQHQPQQQPQQQHGRQQAQQQQQQQLACAPLLPDHLRLMVTPALAACLMQGSSRGSTPCSGSPSLGESPGSSAASTPASSPSRAGSGSIDSADSPGSSSATLRDLSAVDGEPCSPVLPASPACSIPGDSGAPPPEWPAVFEQARQAARQGRWARPGSAHKGEAASAAAAHGSDRHQDSSGFVTALPAGLRWRKAVAWSIPADTESEEEGEADAGAEGRRQGSWPCSSGAPGSVGQLRRPPVGAAAGAAVAHEGEEGTLLPREVADAGAAWRRFTQCSCERGGGRRCRHGTSCRLPHVVPARTTHICLLSLIGRARRCPRIQAWTSVHALTPPPPSPSPGAVVCGMHPDGATEFIVDLALALDKPFAVSGLEGVG